MVQQVDLHRQRYPGRPIEYAFTDLENAPQVIIDALRKVGVDVTEAKSLE